MRRRQHNGYVGYDRRGCKDGHVRQWHDGAGKDQAMVYLAHRSMTEGSVSSFKKRQKFLNIYGLAAQLPEKERLRHVHPQHLRP